MQNQDTLIGQMIDGYQIEDLLGHGGMGRVYRALDINLKRYAALKMMTQPPHKAKTYEKRFYREAQAVAKLKHPNIVAIYRFNEVNDLYYMAMEYVDGADLRWVLRDYANNGELMDYPTLLRIMEQISSALDYAHSNGVIHRDIKPSNIMISRKGDAILTDFGLALDVQEGTGGEIFGSPHYIAPEQAVSSAQAVPQTDFYSLGIILFEMLTGAVPFDSGSALQIAMAHIGDPLPDPRSINPALHEAFVPILETILQKEPRNRFQSGASFIMSLKAAVRVAQKNNSIPTASTLGTPAERIFKNITPLPKPKDSGTTKPATQLAPDTNRQDSQEPPTQLFPAAKTPTRRRSRFSRVMILLLLIVAFLALAFVLFEDELNYQIQTYITGGDTSQVVNALIEGQVSAIEIGNGYITMTIYGVNVQISRSHPLYDTVELNDIVRIEGHYIMVNDALRFNYIASAERNGAVIELESDSE